MDWSHSPPHDSLHPSLSYMGFFFLLTSVLSVFSISFFPHHLYCPSFSSPEYACRHMCVACVFESKCGWGLRFLGGASGRESACPCRRHRDVGSIPGLEKSPGGGNGTSLQYLCLENPMDRGAWQATVHGFTKSQTRLSTQVHTVCWPRDHLNVTKKN